MSHTKVGWKSIHVIAGEGNLKLLEELIEKGRNLMLLTKDGRTMLHIAALNARFAFVQRLLEECPELANKTDIDGWTALHFSVAGGDIQVFQEIAKRGLSPRTKDKYGVTCLHIAAKEGRFNMVKYILDICPDVLHTVTDSGRTAIHDAVEGGYTNIFKELVRRGLRVTSQDKNGSTCLHLAAQKGHCELIRQILQVCPEIKSMHRTDGTSALHDAAMRGFVDVFKELVSLGLPVSAFSETAGNCLHAAAYNGKLEMVRFILTTNPELAEITTAIDAWTVLHLSAAGGHVDVFRVLQDSGADPRQLTAYKGTIFHVAVAHGKCEMVRHLLSVCPDIAEYPRMDGWTPVHQCAADGQIDIFDAFKNSGVKMDLRGKLGETCLHIAASCGQYKMVKHIVKSCPSLLHETKTDGRTALHEAAAGGSIETFDELVRNGARKTVTSKAGETCIHTAAIHGRYNMVLHIIEVCPNLLTAVRENGWTALHDAAAHGHVETCDVLMRAGLSHCVLTEAGETVEDIARRFEQKLILDHILQTEEDSPESSCRVQQFTLGEEQMSLYLMAVKERKERRRNIRLMVVGYEGVGKTSLCWRMMDRTIREASVESTDGIDIYINRFVIDLDTRTRRFLEQETGQEVSIHRIRDVVNEFRKTSLTEDKTEEVKDIKFEESTSTCKTTHSLKEPMESDDTESLELTSSSSLDFSSNMSKDTVIYNTLHKEEVQDSSRVDTMTTTNKSDVRRVMSGLDPDVPEKIHKKAYVSLWDFGGHKEFYNSHHLFLSNDAIYLLVFNVSECLTSKPERQKMKFWLQSIKAHAIPTSSLKRTRSPPIILVGTHIDKVPGGEKEQSKAHEEMLNLLYGDPEVKELIQDHFFGFFTINTPSEPESTFDDLWESIIKAAPCQSQWERELPARWLTLERELMKRRADGVKVMSVRDIILLGQEVETPAENVNDIHLFLRFLRLTGEVLSFPGKEHIMDIVVLDPQWIVHAFRRLITAPKFHHRGSTRYKILWDMYQKSAMIGTELLSLAWARDEGETFLDHKETLLYIMERFGLIASPPLEKGQYRTERSDYFFVPAMLEDADPNWLYPIVNSEDIQLSCSVCFVFNSSVPFTVLDKVLADCVQKFEPFSFPEHDCTRWLQRGLVCFRVDPVINLILCCNDSVVKATIFKRSVDSFQTREGCTIRKILESTIANVLEISHMSSNDLMFDYFLHPDFTLSVDEKRERASHFLKHHEIQVWSSERGEYVAIRRKDYDVWFADLETHNPGLQARTTSLNLPAETLNRKLTCQEMGRISNHIGASYYMFFIELGLQIETIERFRVQYNGNDFQVNIVTMLNAWSERNGEGATIGKVLAAMKKLDMAWRDALRCLNDSTHPAQTGLGSTRPTPTEHSM